ncbi:MAG: VTT domain-containing protein [Rubrivivax sp.]|nr:VTT domain-containing protein [Rubrivivax sp.]
MAVVPGRPLARYWPLAVLAALVLAGLAAHGLDLFEWRTVLEGMRGYRQHAWLPAALILLQVALFTFGLPGSTVLWLVAPLYAPLASTFILAAGGCAGSLAAYAFARRLSGASLAQLRASRGYRRLERESDFLALCALRLIPAFPHSAINYAAGVLHLPLGRFLASTAIGFGLKGYLYSSVIHPAVAAGRPADLLQPVILLPLVALAVVLLAAKALQRRR